MVLLALVLLVRSLLGFGASDEGVRAAPPAVTLLAPADGAVVPDPVPLVFRTTADLSPQPGGWGAGDLHLHAEVDGREVMPGGGDIVRLEGERYKWSLALGASGSYAIRLLWAGPDHRPMPATASPSLRVRIVR